MNLSLLAQTKMPSSSLVDGWYVLNQHYQTTIKYKTKQIHQIAHCSDVTVCMFMTESVSINFLMQWPSPSNDLCCILMYLLLLFCVQNITQAM